MPVRIVFTVIVVFALVSLACGVSFNLPMDPIVTGPLQTEAINLPIPADNDVDLTLKFGAGTFNLAGGADNALVSGEARYNVADFKPDIQVNGGRVSLETGQLKIEGIPEIGGNVVNEWDLQLGRIPMALTISAGAFEGDFDFGGVALTDLDITGGASDVRVDFSTPNPSAMSELRYSTGASSVRLIGLANANFERMRFRAGLGDYTLDFSGALQRDAEVTIQTGVSQVTLVVPEGVNARVVMDGSLSNVQVSGNWKQSGGQGADAEYTLAGSGPLLVISVEMGAGELQLRTR